MHNKNCWCQKITKSSEKMRQKTQN